MTLDLDSLRKIVEDMVKDSAKRSTVNSRTGVQGTGQLLGALTDLANKTGASVTLNPGDFVLPGQSGPSMSAPLAYDLWYLFNDVNLVHHIDPATDSEVYVSENLKFLQEKLNGLKPLKSLTHGGLVAMREGNISQEAGDWANEGAYFIQVMAYEIGQDGVGFEFGSSGPVGADQDKDFVGHMSFPVGQLGIMEVVSMFQETELEADDFELDEEGTPVIIDDPQMFPPMEYAGENRCFGKHLIDGSYLPTDEFKGQLELMANCDINEAAYTQNVKPKSWTRLWIKKTDKFPVPGEFIGILVKPLSVPPHVWWFQESSPLLYAGNWVETQNLTSGVVTMVTLEADRTDGGVGDEYWIRVNGIEFIAYASDFKRYEVDDRVAVLKRWTTSAKAERSFTWKDQRDGTHPVKDQVSMEFMILPITFYEGN